jgi:excisionase family DNA binding protein
VITVPDAAKLSGRNAETIRRWIRTGRLRSEKIGTQHLIREEDLESVLADDAPLPLPSAWSHDAAGRPLVPWESIVRDGRDSH